MPYQPVIAGYVDRPLPDLLVLVGLVSSMRPHQWTDLLRPLS